MKFAINVGSGLVQHEKHGIAAMIAEARIAEDLGFDTAFVPDHYVFESLGTLQTQAPAYEVFFVLTSLAQHTSRIRLGTHVVCMLFRHPAMTARLFAQLDEASNGRVLAGVGAGWTRAEFEMMGIPFPDVSERLRIMDEAVTVMRGLWRGEPLSFKGEHFTLTNAVCRPSPVQQPGPPLMLGGSGNGILRRAGEWADVIHMVPVLGPAGTATVEEIRKFGDGAIGERLARVRRAEAKAGRAPGSAMFGTTIFIFAPTSTPAEGQATLESLSGTFGVPADEIRRHPIVLAGTPEEMVDELRRREATHGLGLLAINFSSEAQLRTFGEKVLPQLA
jgi:probable F420-dependent oxidoreductase